MCYQSNLGSVTYSGGSSMYSGSSSVSASSSLDSLVSEYQGGSHSDSLTYMIAAETQNLQMPVYEFNNAKNDSYQEDHKSSAASVVGTFYTNMDQFLDPSRNQTVFVGEAKEIKEFVEETFQKLTGESFPKDVQIKVVSKEEMGRLNNNSTGDVIGCALNRKNQGLVSEIFLKKDMLDRMMLTVGHEIGHVLSKRLESAKDEEAKAFAFSIAWMKTIKEHNIANLATSIRLDAPAKNGLHDVALEFVLKLVNKGREAMDVYSELVNGLLNMKGDVIW